MYAEPNGYYDPQKVSGWALELLNRAAGDIQKLLEQLSRLNRRENWLFWDEIGRHTDGYDNKSREFKKVLTEFGNPQAIEKQLHKFMVAQCFDERPAVYPDAVITDWAWNIIKRAEKDRDKLTNILRGLSRGELYRFDDEYEQASGGLRDDIFYPYMTHDSEDSVEDVTHWVTSEGKEYYFSVWNNPQTIPYSFSEIKNAKLWCWGAASEVYEEKYDEDLADFEP